MVADKRVRRVALALLVAFAALFVVSSSAVAAPKVKIEVDGEVCFVDPYGPLVCPNEIERDTDTDVQSDVLERQPTLPFTGADVTLFVVTGAALIATGALVVRRTRAARSNNPSE